jgi:hypothetical protein
LKTRGLLEIFVDCGLISKKCMGLSTNIAWISLARNYCSTGNSVDLIHHLWTGRHGSGPWWIEATWIRGHDGALQACDTLALGLPVLAGGGGGGGGETDEVVSEGCSPGHKRWRRGGAMVKKTGGGLSSLRG